MRTTRKQLETMIQNYNSYEFSIVKLKLNDGIVGGINLYTTDNQLISTGKLSEIAKILDALINMRILENVIDYGTH